MLYQVLIIAYVLIAISLVGLILIQQGKGADMGASFGAGSSATLFGSSGSGNFLTKTTTYLAVGFFIISLVLGNLTANRVKATDEWNNLADTAAQTTVGSAEPVNTDTLAVNEDVPAADKAVAAKENDVPE
ncbi:MAG: preprotein translocase subunit SecG [Thalassotalea sp.]